MALNDLYHCALVFQHADAEGEMVTILHYKQSNDVAPGTEVDYMTALADAIEDEFDLNYVNDITTDIEFDRIEIYNMDKPTFAYTHAVNKIGAAVGEAAPLRSAPVVTKNTAFRGRSYRGRNFLMPPPESEQNAGVMLSGYVLRLETFMTGLLQLTGVGFANLFELQVYSKKLSDLSGLTENFNVTGFVVRTNLATQRGRQATS